MCIAQFNLYLVVLVVAMLPITRPAIASHNLARFNPGINPGIKQTQSRNPGIGKTVRDCIPYMLGILSSRAIVTLSLRRAVSLIFDFKMCRDLEIAVYLGNGARQADGYYGTLIGSRGCRIGWDNFR